MKIVDQKTICASPARKRRPAEYCILTLAKKGNNHYLFCKSVTYQPTEVDYEKAVSPRRQISRSAFDSHFPLVLHEWEQRFGKKNRK